MSKEALLGCEQYIGNRKEITAGNLTLRDGTTSTEFRVVDPKTGGEKGQKTAQFSLIPARWLWALAEHYGRGASKYSDRNWEKGYDWKLSYDASQRHLHQWIMGERNDTETGSHHLVAAAWHLIALWFFDTMGKGTDSITALPGTPRD